MNILKKAIIALILLGVVVFFWIGSSIYYQNSSVEINSKAQEHMKVLRKTFDLEELEKVTERTKNSFPVSPTEFMVLIEKN